MKVNESKHWRIDNDRIELHRQTKIINRELDLFYAYLLTSSKPTVRGVA